MFATVPQGGSNRRVASRCFTIYVEMKDTSFKDIRSEVSTGAVRERGQNY